MIYPRSSTVVAERLTITVITMILIMNKVVQKQRHSEVNNFIERNEDVLLAWAYSHGIIPRSDEDLPYIKAEIVGRVLAAKAIKIVSGYTSTQIQQQAIGTNYDMEAPNGTHIEVKFKYNDNSEYPSDDISLSKMEYNYDLSYDGTTQVIIPFYDGVVRCYDLFGQSTTGWWDKNRRTVVESDVITEEKLKFNPSDALWEIRITMPDWDAII